MNPLIQAFYDKNTNTFSYVVYDKLGGHAAIIDSVLDYDPKSGRTDTKSADQLIMFLKEHNLKLQWILETHAHADHLSAAYYLKQALGGKIGIGEPICQVQKTFKAIFNFDDSFKCDGSQFDHLFVEGESFNIGELNVKIIAVPGHTPADVAYHIGNAVFVGDTLFMPDVGSARCDFPGGNAHTLYNSIHKILSLPADTRLLMCHDYPPSTRPHMFCFESNIKEQLQKNIHIQDGISENDFVKMREARDKGKEMPNLILPSIQINIRAGQMPPAENNGIHYLKIPLNKL